MRKVRHSFILGVLGGSLAFSAASAAPSAAPQEFTAYIGGFLGASFAVEWTGKELIYSTKQSGKGMVVTARLQPTQAQWKAFKTAIEKAGVGHWRASYMNNQVMDGTQWALTVKFKEFKTSSQGSNSYPLQNGEPGNDPSFTPAFEAYLKAVKTLLRGRTFR